MSKLINSIVRIKDGNKIPSEHAKLLIQTYRDEEGHGDKKSRAIWFSVSDLAEILALATATVDEKVCNGIRIYLAKYPKDATEIQPPNSEYFSRETLVFVPTYDQIVGGIIKRRNLFDVFASIVRPIDGNEGFNHGELCPPETGCP